MRIAYQSAIGRWIEQVGGKFRPYQLPGWGHHQDPVAHAAYSAPEVPRHEGGGDEAEVHLAAPGGAML